MKRMLLRIELMDSLVFSRRSATEGGHETLDHVPGSALWGCFCQALYGKQHPFADDVAHWGKVWFGNGRPMGPDKSQSWPVPLSWYTDKTRPERPAVVAGRLQPDHVVNAVHGDLSEMGQPRAVRPGYVGEHGHWFAPTRQFRLRTALARPDHPDEDSQLYGYQGLTKGQHFGALLAVHDDAIAKEIKTVFDGQIVRIGRSKSGEYGRTRCHIDHNPAPLPVSPGDNASELMLWLLSEACLRDEWGQPTLWPEPATLGLPGALLDASRSFVRHRQFVFYNGHRRTHGLAHQALAAGSVLTFSRPGQPFSPEERSRLAAGIGTLRERGFGEVWVNPPILVGAHPPQPMAEALVPPYRPKPLQPRKGEDSPLMAWARAQAEERLAAHEAEQRARQALHALAGQLLLARNYNGLRDDEPCGPGRSQWGRFGQICRDAGDANSAIALLFEKPSALIKQTSGAQPDWTLALGDGEDKRLSLWIKQQIEDWAKDSPWPRLQRALCLWAAVAREADLRQHGALQKHLPTESTHQEAAP